MNDPFAGPGKSQASHVARPSGAGQGQSGGRGGGGGHGQAGNDGGGISATLIEENLDYVKALARELHQRIGGTVEYDELVALGNQGLVEAARAFDPIHGASFRTYAYYRIRGTIIDAMRRMSWSRTSRATARDEELRDSAMRDAAGLADSEADIGRLEDEFCRGIRRLAIIHVVADLHDREDVPVADADVDPVERAELHARLVRALAQLEPTERELITSLYLDCKSMTEYAKELGVNKSTVTRRHAEAIESLKRLIEGSDLEPARADRGGP
ncbi:MAG: sigma-70 family RNA polymerase sigma factor [Phycisphaerales bacterium]|nr:sigma-70 family RNA polymerase sigma factor [Phycisphaerales bacterium]